MFVRILLALTLVIATTSSCTCSPSSMLNDETVGILQSHSTSFNVSDITYSSQLQEFMLEEHPFGSARQIALAEIIRNEGQRYSKDAMLQEFDTVIPNPILLEQPDAPAPKTLAVKGQNILTRVNLNATENCVVVIGSHYDTKRLTEGHYLGANDSASSSILLLQMLEYLNANPLPTSITCDLLLVWFDGEESILPEWTDGQFRHPANMVDNTYGSRHFVSQLTSCPSKKTTGLCLGDDWNNAEIAAVVIVDMVGSHNLKITQELLSSVQLRNLLRTSAEKLGMKSLLASYREIEDDHVPFVRAKIPALNVIDFENLQHWHQPTDVAETISPRSIETAGRLAMFIALQIAASPESFQNQ